MRAVIFFVFFFGLKTFGFALMAEVEKYDAPKYEAVAGTENVVYFDKCSRKKLKQFEWSVWKGNYQIKARIQPLAIVTVQRDKQDVFTPDGTPFIQQGIEASMEVGGNVICYVALKKSKQALGIESITFRAYRQVIQSGNKTWESFYNDRIAEGLPIMLWDIKDDL